MIPSRQDFLETSFVSSLVQKLVPSLTNDLKFERDESTTALLLVSSRRINATISVIEKNISFKSKTILVVNDDITEEVGYYMLILCDILEKFLSSIKTSNGASVTSIADNICSDLVGTLFETYSEIYSHWDNERYARLEPICGRVIQICCQFASSYIIKKMKGLLESYGDNNSESIANQFLPLRVMHHLELDFDGLTELLSVISVVITPPGGTWKKQALLELATPLRSCILSWMKRDASVFRDMYAGRSTSIVNKETTTSLSRVVGRILMVMEQWTGSGLRKRAVLWPTMCLLIRLLPDDLAKAVDIIDAPKSKLLDNSIVNLIARLLRFINKSLRPTKFASVMHTDGVTLSELSVVFLVQYLQVSAIVKSCSRVDDVRMCDASSGTRSRSSSGINVGSPPGTDLDSSLFTKADQSNSSSTVEESDGRSRLYQGSAIVTADIIGANCHDSSCSIAAPSTSMGPGDSSSNYPMRSDSSMSAYGQSVLIERYFFPYDNFILHHRVKLEAMLMSGQYPSTLYYSCLDGAFSNYAPPELSSEYTAVTLLSIYLWSLYFLDAESYLRLSYSCLAKSAVPSCRIAVVAALMRILEQSKQFRWTGETDAQVSVSSKSQITFSTKIYGGKAAKSKHGCDNIRAIGRSSVCNVLDSFWSYDVSSQVKSRMLGLIVAYARNSSKPLECESIIIQEINQVLKSTSYHFLYEAELGMGATDLNAVLSIIKLVALNPGFVLIRNIDLSRRGTIEETTIHSIFSTTFVAYFSGILGELISLLQAKETLLADAASNALFSIISAESIRLWNTKDIFSGLICVSSVALVRISVLLSNYESENTLQTLRVLKVLFHIIDTVNDFLSNAEDEASFQMSDLSFGLVSFRKHAVDVVESSIVLHLCSNDTDIAALSARCLALLSTNHDLIEGQEISLGSWGVYKEIAEPSNQLLMPSDRQKRVRTLLGGAAAKSLGVRWALLAIRCRWSELGKVVKPCTDITMIFTYFEEWSNYSSILCALAEGLGEASDPVASMTQLFIRANNSALDAPATNGDENSRQIRATFAAKDVVDELLSLIIFNATGVSDKKIAQNALISLGMYLSPSLIPHLFHVVTTVLEHILMGLQPSENSQVVASGNNKSNSLGNLTNDKILDYNRCASLSRAQLLSTLNFLITMLEMVFDRVWYSRIDFEKTSVEELLFKLISIVTRMRSHPVANSKLGGNSSSPSVLGGAGHGSANSPGYDNNIVGGNANRSKVLKEGSHSSDRNHSNTLSLHSHFHSNGKESSMPDPITRIDAYKLKRKACTLILTFMKSKAHVYVSNSFCLRIVTYVMTWTDACVSLHFANPNKANSVLLADISNSDNQKAPRFRTRTASDNSDLGVPTYTAAELEMYRNSEISFIRTVCVLLLGTKIIPEEIESFCDDEVAAFYLLIDPTDDGVSTLASTSQRCSQLFHKLFHVLVSALDSCDNNVVSQSTGILMNRCACGLYIAEEENLVVGVVDACIDALTNLFDSNIGVGFKHLTEAATLPANTDAVRSAYIQVINRVLSKHGTDFGLVRRNLNDNISYTYQELLEGLRQWIKCSSNSNIRLAMCKAVQTTREADMLANNLMILCVEDYDGLQINFVPSRKSSLNLLVVRNLLEQLIPLEVSSTLRLGSLFRNESVCTKLMGLYFTLVGKQYLKAALEGPIRRLLIDAPELEVDPSKFVFPGGQEGSGKNEMLERNCSSLQERAKEFLDALIEAVETSLSNDIKFLLKLVSKEAVRKFGGAKSSGCDRIAVGGYFFLRFVCPAIALPSKYNLLPVDYIKGSQRDSSLSKQSSRTFLLIVKVLQNLANGTHFNEDYMLSINHWIDSNDAVFVQFCKHLSTPDEAVISDSAANLRKNSGGNGNEISVAEASVLNKESLFDAMVKVHAFLHRQKLVLNKSLEVPQSDAAIETGVGSSSPTLARSIESEEAVIPPSPQFSHKDDSPSNSSDVMGTLHAKLSSDSEYNSFAFIMEYLGDPSKRASEITQITKGFKIEKEFAAGIVGTPSKKTPSSTSDSLFPPECQVFMASTEASPGFAGRYRILQQKKIFYCLGLPKEATFVFVLRRVEATTDMYLLLYSMVKSIHKAITRKITAFDIVIDSAAFNLESVSEPFTLKKWWGRMKTYLEKSISFYLRKVYVLYPSKELSDLTRPVLRVWNIKSSMCAKITSVLLPSQLCEKLPHVSSEFQHSMAMNIESGISQKWSCVRHKKALDIYFSNRMVVLECSDTFSGMKYKRTDMIPLQLVDRVQCGQAGMDGTSSLADSVASMMGTGSLGLNPVQAAQQYAAARASDVSKGRRLSQMFLGGSSNPSNNFDMLLVNLSWHSRSFRVYTPQAKGLETAFNNALSKERKQTALDQVVKLAGAKATVTLDAMPGSLLFVSIYNLFSTAEAVRRSAYVLLGNIKECFEVALKVPVYGSESISLPEYPLDFAIAVSSSIAKIKPEYGYEFIFECVEFLGLEEVSQAKRIACIMCLKPWIPCLTSLLVLLHTLEDEGEASQSPSKRWGPNKEESEGTSGISSAFDMQSPGETNNHPSFGGSNENTPEKNEKEKGCSVEGRQFDIGAEELVAKVINMFEVVLKVHCSDAGLSIILKNEFWKVIAKDVKLTSYALKYFMNRWVGESRNSVTLDQINSDSCLMPDPLYYSQTSGGKCDSNVSLFASVVRAVVKCETNDSGYGAVEIPSTPMPAQSAPVRRLSKTAARMPFPIAGSSSIASTPENSAVSPGSMIEARSISLLCSNMCSITSLLAVSQPTLVSGLLLNRTIRSINQPYTRLLAEGGDAHTAGNFTSGKRKCSGIAKSPGRGGAAGVAIAAAPDSVHFQDVISLFRPLLCLPFQNGQLLVAKLPDLLHIVVLLVAQGPSNLRVGVHGLICSIVHSLIGIVSTNPSYLSKYSSSTQKNRNNGVGSDMNLSVLKRVLELLTGSQFRYIFYEAQTMTLNNLVLLVHSLSELVLTSDSRLCEKWRRRWWKIAMATAADTLPATPSARCFITIAALTRPNDLIITDEEQGDVFLKFFEALKLSFVHSSSLSEGDGSLSLHMYRSLSKLVPLMDDEQLFGLFWVMIVAVHVSKVDSFEEAFRLISSLLKELMTRFPDSSIEQKLLSFRCDMKNDDHCIGSQMLSSFEELVGIKFYCQGNYCADTEKMHLLNSIYFTYGVTLSIIGGFSIPSIRDDMIGLFQNLAKHFQRASKGSSGLSAYAAVLFCFVHETEDKWALFQQEGKSSSGNGSSLTRSASGIINKYNIAVNLSNEGPVVSDSCFYETENNLFCYRASFFTQDVFPDDSVAVLYTGILLVMLDKIEVVRSTVCV